MDGCLTKDYSPGQSQSGSKTVGKHPPEKTMSNSTPTPAAWRLGLVGRKVGMTRIFTEEGESIPVTVLDVSNNRVAQRSEEHTSELQSRENLVCRLLLDK